MTYNSSQVDPPERIRCICDLPVVSIESAPCPMIYHKNLTVWRLAINPHIAPRVMMIVGF